MANAGFSEPGLLTVEKLKIVRDASGYVREEINLEEDSEGDRLCPDLLLSWAIRICQILGWT